MAAVGDLWLLRFGWSNDACETLGREVPRSATRLQVWRSIDGKLGYAYLPAQAPDENPPPPALGTDWRRLICTLAVAGSAQGIDAAYHYIVETDVLPEQEADFNAWYEREHLPGLAAVPGTVHAARYVAVMGSPRYYACYDLASLDTFGSPEWLAVRATPWSSRVRPAFRNTRRTMFRRATPPALSPCRDPFTHSPGRCLANRSKPMPGPSRGDIP
jgi:hypothetical protein